MCRHIFTLHTCGHKKIEHEQCDLVTEAWHTLSCDNYTTDRQYSNQCGSDGTYCSETTEGRRLETALQHLAKREIECYEIVSTIRDLIRHIETEHARSHSNSVIAAQMHESIAQSAVLYKEQLCQTFNTLFQDVQQTRGHINALKNTIRERRDSTINLGWEASAASAGREPNQGLQVTGLTECLFPRQLAAARLHRPSYTPHSYTPQADDSVHHRFSANFNPALQRVPVPSFHAQDISQHTQRFAPGSAPSLLPPFTTPDLRGKVKPQASYLKRRQSSTNKLAGRTSQQSIPSPPKKRSRHIKRSQSGIRGGRSSLSSIPSESGIRRSNRLSARQKVKYVDPPTSPSSDESTISDQDESSTGVTHATGRPRSSRKRLCKDDDSEQEQEDGKAPRKKSKVDAEYNDEDKESDLSSLSDVEDFMTTPSEIAALSKKGRKTVGNVRSRNRQSSILQALPPSNQRQPSQPTLLSIQDLYEATPPMGDDQRAQLQELVEIRRRWTTLTDSGRTLGHPRRILPSQRVEHVSQPRTMDLLNRGFVDMATANAPIVQHQQNLIRERLAQRQQSFGGYYHNTPSMPVSRSPYLQSPFVPQQHFQAPFAQLNSPLANNTVNAVGMLDPNDRIQTAHPTYPTVPNQTPLTPMMQRDLTPVMAPALTPTLAHGLPSAVYQFPMQQVPAAVAPLLQSFAEQQFPGIPIPAYDVLSDVGNEIPAFSFDDAECLEPNVFENADFASLID